MSSIDPSIVPPTKQHSHSTTTGSSRLLNKVAIVTGSSTGLGRAVALAFAAEGARLVVCADLQPNSTSDFGAAEAGTPTHEVICDKYGKGRSFFVKTDVSVGKEVEDLVREAVKAGGRLDIMVNNAGIIGKEGPGRVHETTEETWDLIMKTNSRSVFLGCKFACEQFLRQELHSSGHRGWIVNSSSILGLVGKTLGAWTSAYSASKGAILAITRQVAMEYAAEKIHCNAICPGYLKTPLGQSYYENEEFRAAVAGLTPMGDWGLAEDIARGYVFMASEDAAYVTGVALPMDGGFIAQ